MQRKTGTKNQHSLTDRRPTSTIAEYSKRMLIAEQLVRTGCKWPVVMEIMHVRGTDARRLVQEIFPGGELHSRPEKGMYWFRAPGEYNLRMLHADFLYWIYRAYRTRQPEFCVGQCLLSAFNTYRSLVRPVIDNINRAWYLLDSAERGKGFVIRQCRKCRKDYVAIGAMETEHCQSCERNQYIFCKDCSNIMDDPYSPGRNGNKRVRCISCAERWRSRRRKLQRRRRSVYISSYRVL